MRHGGKGRAQLGAQRGVRQGAQKRSIKSKSGGRKVKRGGKGGGAVKRKKSTTKGRARGTKSLRIKSICDYARKSRVRMRVRV